LNRLQASFHLSGPTTEVSAHSAGHEEVPCVWPFNATEKLDPDVSELLSMHCSWCVLDCGEDEVDKALAKIKEALAMRADYAPALNVLGDVNFEKANFPAAAEAYRQSLAFGPSQKAIAARYATSLAASVSAQAAAAHYSEWSRSAAPAAPDLDWFVVEEVGLQLLAGEAAPAKTFEQILAKSENADAPLIQARLGWWYYRANNAETAAELIAYGQEIRPA
jgi:hypothetical protein